MHRWLGTAAGAGAVVLLILSELAWRRGGASLTLFRVVLFLAVPLVMATGFFGGGNSGYRTPAARLRTDAQIGELLGGTLFEIRVETTDPTTGAAEWSAFTQYISQVLDSMDAPQSPDGSLK